jgi:L-seryl-tRNA(Ser) seleniumtransferase
MSADAQPRSSPVPSIEHLLQAAERRGLIESFGRNAVRFALRSVVEEWRVGFREGAAEPAEAHGLLAAAEHRLMAECEPQLRPVFNLTGTVLHTNLGRAPLPRAAVDAVARVALGACNLEFDLEGGARGDRDAHVEEWLCRLTGAEAATLVNNNAAAVLLVLSTLARGKEVVVSRGELVEIGGSFRIPDIMRQAGAKLREVGTTNRTHAQDYEAALSPRTGLAMRVHPSNYRIEGFTASASDDEIARICRLRGLPFVVDLGSGSLVDLERFGLPHERTPREAVAAGADLVTFSGDKLLGGPQAGLIVGRRDLVALLKRNPLKRALRCDKMTIAALGAVLPLFADPERLSETLPALALLTRPERDIAALTARILPDVARALDGLATAAAITCCSQIGSGAFPTDLLPSAGLRLSPVRSRTAPGLSVQRLARALRQLPTPVIGRIEKRSVVLDMRCLADEEAFIAQLPVLYTLLMQETNPG